VNDWNFEDFPLGGIESQIVRFKVIDNEYVMTFNRLEAELPLEDIKIKSTELNIEYRPNSYKVYFDWQDNFENGTFYEQPPIKRGITEIKELGEILGEIINSHYKKENTEAYFFLADNFKLKKFYDRLAAKYSSKLEFIVNTNIGGEELGYEIRTPAYKSAYRQSRGYEKN
jgi:hypothetical protein